MADLGVASAGYLAGGALTYGSSAYGIGTSVGWAIGSYVGTTLFGKKNEQKFEGPRVDDLTVQTSAYGAPIADVFGTARIAGNLFWATDIKETKHTFTPSSGGKGGGGGGSGQTYTWYTYTCSFAIGLCEGEISGIGRIWADSKIYLDLRKNVWDQYDESGSVNNLLNITQRASEYTIYTGTTTQNPDPTMEGIEGAGEVPGYRGLAYVVFEDMDLMDFGVHIPNMTFEIFKAGVCEEQEDTLNMKLPVMPQFWIKTQYPEKEKIYYPDRVFDILHFAIDPLTGTLVTGGHSSSLGSYPIYTHNSITNAFDKTSPTVVARWYGAPDNSYNHWKLSGLTVKDGGLISLFCEDSYNLNQVPTDPRVRIFYHPGINGDHVQAYDVKSAGLWGQIHGCSIRGDDFVYHGWASPPTYARVFHIKLYRSGWEFINEWQSYSFGFTDDYGATQNITDVHIHPRTGNLWIFGPAPGDQQQAREFYGISNNLKSTRIVSTGIQYLATHKYQYINEDYAWVGMGHYFPVDEPSEMRLINFDENWAPRTLSFIKYTDANYQKLDTVVSKFCTDSGLEESDFDVTDLASTELIGYLRARRMTARAAIEPLQMLYLFDVVEIDKKIIFRMRGDASDRTIPSTDLSAKKENSDDISELEILFANEEDLPTAVDFKFIHFGRDYEESTQRYEIKSPPNQNHFVVNMPVIMNNTKGLQAAQRLLITAQAGNKRFTFQTTAKHIDLVPTDVVTIDANRIRIIETTYTDGVIKFIGSSEWDAEQYTSTLEAEENDKDPQFPGTAAQTALDFFDLPALRTAENTIGFYIAAYGLTGGISAWYGCIIYRSLDGGAVWNQILTTTASAVIGTSDFPLEDALPSVWDRGNTISVDLQSGTLSSVTELQLLNGANVAAFGYHGHWEIIQFKNATLEADGSYTLDTFLRGRLDTHIHINPNASDFTTMKFLLLDETYIRDTTHGVEYINAQLPYRAVSIGSQIYTAYQRDFTNTCQRLKPFQVQHVKAHPDAAGTLNISWIRCDRFILDDEWADYASATKMSESIEQYEIDILASSGGTVQNTYVVDDVSTFAYNGTMQTADFGYAQLGETIYFNIYQMSAIAGRGHVYEGSAYCIDEQPNTLSFWDDFTGNDSDPPDSLRWVRSPSLYVYINNNMLRTEAKSNYAGGIGKVTSNFRLSGNFEIVVDFEQINTISYAYASFRLVDPFSSWWGEIRFYRYSTTSRVQSSTSLESRSSGLSFTNNRKFKIIRNYNVPYFQTYYWNGSAWVEYSEGYWRFTTGIPTGPLRVELMATNHNSSSLFKWNWDNFKIIRGTATQQVSESSSESPSFSPSASLSPSASESPSESASESASESPSEAP
jgi:hypothetical protein